MLGLCKRKLTKAQPLDLNNVGKVALPKIQPILSNSLELGLFRYSGSSNLCDTLKSIGLCYREDQYYIRTKSKSIFQLLTSIRSDSPLILVYSFGKGCYSGHFHLEELSIFHVFKKRVSFPF